MQLGSSEVGSLAQLLLEGSLPQAEGMGLTWLPLPSRGLLGGARAWCRRDAVSGGLRPPTGGEPWGRSSVMRDVPPGGCAGHMGWGPTPGVGDCTLSARPSPVEGDNECRLRLLRELWAGAQCRARPPGFLLGSPVPPRGAAELGG